MLKFYEVQGSGQSTKKTPDLILKVSFKPTFFVPPRPSTIADDPRVMDVSAAMCTFCQCLDVLLLSGSFDSFFTLAQSAPVS